MHPLVATPSLEAMSQDVYSDHLITSLKQDSTYSKFYCFDCQEVPHAALINHVCFSVDNRCNLLTLFLSCRHHICRWIALIAFVLLPRRSRRPCLDNTTINLLMQIMIGKIQQTNNRNKYQTNFRCSAHRARYYSVVLKLFHYRHL